ncbi:hypothetical protein [Streptosporangium jomthongense]|uniref:Uncharacterized protein n=1 Tax=Streptosporangium jomthongense TaxID=1193683 RepID=A0ABV8EYD0_9ACTN
MEPITFILWMWVTWGTVRMMTGKNPSSESASPETAPAADTPRVGWAQRADEAAARARTTDWGNPGWWLRAGLAAAWTPVSDLRKARAWYKDRRTGDETEPEIEAPEPNDQEAAPEPAEARRTEDAEPPKAETADAPHPPQDSPEPTKSTQDENEGDASGRTGGARSAAGERIGGRPDDGAHQGDTSQEPWWRRYQRPDEYEVEVEVVPSHPADPAALAKPIPALTAPAPTAPAQGAAPVAEPPSYSAGPAVRTVPDATGIGQIEGTPTEMSKYVAIPGMNAPAPTTSVEVGGNTHDDAVELSKKIVKAVNMTTTPVAEAEAMIRASLAAAWNAVDALAAAGVGGAVIDRWAEAVIAFDTAHKTAKKLKQEVDDAHEAAKKAERLQSRLGNEIQAAVQAAGKSAANFTGYYGKR